MLGLKKTGKKESADDQSRKKGKVNHPLPPPRRDTGEKGEKRMGKEVCRRVKREK